MGSLFLGYLALLQIIKGQFINAVYLIGVSVILDGFDGTVARLTKTESNFGVQLDSLVDAVTFGLVTSIMIYYWGFKGINPQMGKIIGFIFLSAGVIRLARFNVLKEAHVMPANIFVGLPIPLGALSIVSTVLVVGSPLTSSSEMLIFSFFVILIAFLMISSVKYRTLKRVKSKYNLLILLCLAVIIALSINFPQYTLPAVTSMYLVSPLFFFFYNKIKRKAPSTAVIPTESHSHRDEESRLDDDE